MAHSAANDDLMTALCPGCDFTYPDKCLGCKIAEREGKQVERIEWLVSL